MSIVDVIMSMTPIANVIMPIATMVTHEHDDISNVRGYCEK
jgi:hypothetical protein